MVLACLSMLKAFRYEVASAPRYLRVSTNTSASTDVPQPTEKRLRDLKISSTFAGLTPSQSGIMTDPSDAHMLVAVHEVPAHAVNIDPDTGAVDFSEESKVVDPLGGEVFDTPEFADSAEATRKLPVRTDRHVRHVALGISVHQLANLS